MKGSKPMWLAGCIIVVSGFLAVLFACGQFAAAQESNQVADPSKNKILDLVFRIDDLGGKVQDLQVKETGQEIRIELAADVLFDFDKADLRPAAQKTLHQAAGIIQDKAKGDGPRAVAGGRGV